MTKEIYIDGFVFLPLHIYKKHLLPPMPNLLLTGENIIIFSSKTFYVLIFKKNTTLLNIFFGQNVEHRKELTRLALLNYCKMFVWCNIWPFIMILISRTKTIISFFYFKDYYLETKHDLVARNEEVFRPIGP